MSKESANQLQIIVKESGLEQTKASYILEHFQGYFEIADEWAKKAAVIKVTDASQKAEMEMARAGRKFLQQKRIDVEKARKALKEQALREGKAIDGIANVLKALIVPIEEYLDKQEHFVEIKEAEEKAKKQAEIERRMEEERIAKEKAEHEASLAEQKRIREENERLRNEAIERQKQMEAEREKAEAEKRLIEEKARKEREEAELKAKREREKQARLLAEQKTKAEAEKKALEAQAKKERELAERALVEEKAKHEELIECPFCHKTFKIK